MNRKQAIDTIHGLPDAARVRVMDGQAVVYMPLEDWPPFEEAIRTLAPTTRAGPEAPEP